MADYAIPHDWEEPDDLHRLLESIREQRDDANLRRIRYAYYLAEQAHAGQVRKSGVAYIHHPLAVAQILVDLGLDDDTICAAFLHDVLEDTDVTADILRQHFGDDVVALVDGVTKLKLRTQADDDDRQRARAETQRQAETLRKLLLAMGKDFRVIVIKLADRLHNMRTLEHMSERSRARIAQETLDVYAPLAARVGIWQIKWQLEDLCFMHLHPEEYRRVREMVAQSRAQREADLQQAIVLIKERLQAAGIRNADVRGRPKHLYSIFNKMVKGNLEFDEITDLLGLRILVDDKLQCYTVLGVIHGSFTPIQDLFFDYIASPKPNGYQSIHTKVVGPNGRPLEVQIRTVEMHRTAEFGVAAHWTYKEGKVALDETARFQQLREQLFDWSSDARLSSDFLRSVSTDLFSEQVFVFTPKGDVIDLPVGATPVDFAFRVHTALGMKLVGARVNGQIAQLDRQLQNGDVVELITRSNAKPSLDWLQFVRSTHTRAKLRSHFRHESREVDAMRGRDILERDLKALGLDPKAYLGEDRFDQAAKHFDAENGTALLARVGAGLTSAQAVIQRLRGMVPEAPRLPTIHVKRMTGGKSIVTSGDYEGIAFTRAKCCNPIPGDEVVGFISRGRGLTLHRSVCPNARHLEETAEPGRILPFSWSPDGSVYDVALRIVTVNRQGLLMDISTILGESKTNIVGADIRTSPNHTAEIKIGIEVSDVQHLQAITTKIGNYQDVISIERRFGALPQKSS